MPIEIINARSDAIPSRNTAVYKKAPSSVNARTTALQERFLKAYTSQGTITHAAKESGVDSRRHYEWLDTDPTYPQRFKEAYNASVDSLELEAIRRARDGVEEPTGWYKGEPGGFVKKYSDTLLIFLLKGARPEKYKDRTELSGSIDVNTSPIPLDKLSTTLKRLLVLELTGGRLDPQLVSGIEDYLARYEQEREVINEGGQVIDTEKVERVEEINYKMLEDGDTLLDTPHPGRLTYQPGWGVVSLEG